MTKNPTEPPRVEPPASRRPIPPDPEDPDVRHQKKLISIALFLSMVNMVMGSLMSPGGERRYMAWVAPFMVLAFILSRTRFYRLGSAIAMAGTFALMAFFILFLGVKDESIIIPLTYFTATIFMVSFWLSFRWLVALAVCQTGFVLTFAGADPAASDIVLRGWLPLNAFVVALILMSRWVQDRNERRLREYREHLEELVAARSRDLSEANEKLKEKIDQEQRISRNLERTVAQKDALLRELYHRSKNNMQVISSMLHLQASRTDAGGVKDVLSVARERIRSIALVHERLLQSGDLAVINLEGYLKSLAAELVRSYAPEADRVAFALEAEPVSISIDQAVPLGLVANELLTNALKYAFPEGRRGRIGIRIARGDGDEVEFEVSDDGIGFSPGFDPRSDGGLGYKLVHSIVERQLEGSLRTLSDGGVRSTVRFRLKSFSRGAALEAGLPTVRGDA